MTQTPCPSLYTSVQAEEAALELQLGELQRAMHAMTDDPANRCRLYLTDREVCTHC